MLKKISWGIVSAIIVSTLISYDCFSGETDPTVKSAEVESPGKPDDKAETPSGRKPSVGETIAGIVTVEGFVALISSIGYLDHGAFILGVVDAGAVLNCIKTGHKERSEGADNTFVIPCSVGFASMGVYNFYLDNSGASKDRVFLTNFIGINLLPVLFSIKPEKAVKLSARNDISVGLFVHPNEVVFKLVKTW